jgi:hypothetical protein
MIYVLIHKHFSGLAVTSIVKSFSGVIKDRVSIAEALEGCQFGRLSPDLPPIGPLAVRWRIG